MKAVKGRGRGLTHGRGVDESIRTVWVQSMHQCASITLATMNLSGLHSDSLQGHRELGRSRIRRDNADLLRAVDWLHVNNPFTSADGRLYSLSSRTIAATSDDLNCDHSRP